MTDAGMLRDRVTLMALEETASGWEWRADKGLWAKVTMTGGRNLFSAIGLGARAAEIVMRRRPLSLHQALRYRDYHLFLTEITEPERGWLAVKAAVVELSACQVIQPEEGPIFPGILTLKHQKYAQETPMATLTTAYVLVTPKAISLRPGSLLEVTKPGSDKPDYFVVNTDYTLDPSRNEYEISKEDDL